jgi:hypothetical protein
MENMKSQSEIMKRQSSRRVRMPVLTSMWLFVTWILVTSRVCVDAMDVKVVVLVAWNESYLFSYHRTAPAVLFAVEKVNMSPRLRNHRLVVTFHNTWCESKWATHRAIDAYIKKQVQP